MGLKPLVFGIEGADIVGSGGGLGAALAGGFENVLLAGDSESE